MRWAVACRLLLVGLLLALVAPTEASAENQRRTWVKKYDTDGDKRLKGKEARTFRKDHPKPFEKLLAWCDRATEKPRKAGVDLPKGKKEAGSKCKKSRIDRPYLTAWMQAAADGPDNPCRAQPPPRKPPGKRPDRPHNPCGPPANPCGPDNPCGPPADPCNPCN